MTECGCRAGRTMRKRRRKRGSTDQSVSLSHLPQYVSLMKFLHHRGFTSTQLQPNHFTDTGRGLQARHTIKPGELVISLPESCLITTSTVLNSYLGHYIKSWKSRLSPLLVLCVFLVCERHQGEDSDWFPYVNVLPSFYTCPTYFSDEVMAVLPSIVRRRALEQRREVLEIHSSNQDFFRSLQPILRQPVEKVFTYEALRWAFFSVNTRSVFMSRPANPFLSGEDTYVLAPFLDLLNHRPDVKVAASFNPVTRCYEIRSAAGIQRYQQAFINYGAHDNQRLLLEYGFVTPGNPHSVIYVETDHLRNALRGDRSLDQKMKFLKENNFSHNLTASSDGPSWRLMTVLRLLALPQTMYPHWKAVLLGQAVSAEREQWSIQTAQTLCQQLLQDNHEALNKISQLLLQYDQPIREQLDVVRSLRQEERGILESCLLVLRGMLRQPSSAQSDTGL